MITAAAGLVASQVGLAQIEPGTIDRIPAEPGTQREKTPPVATPPYNPESGTESRNKATQEQTLVRVTELVGSNVKSQDGQRLGAIKDVVFDGASRKMNFAVLGRGGFLGVGEQLVPVPWQTISMQGEREWVLNVDREKLRSAPTLQKDGSGELDRPEFISRVNEHFGVQPEAVGGTGSQSESQKGQQQSDELGPEQRHQFE